MYSLCRGGETAYALVSGTSDRKVVWVQIPSSAPSIIDLKSDYFLYGKFG